MRKITLKNQFIAGVFASAFFCTGLAVSAQNALVKTKTVTIVNGDTLVNETITPATSFSKGPGPRHQKMNSKATTGRDSLYKEVTVNITSDAKTGEKPVKHFHKKIMTYKNGKADTMIVDKLIDAQDAFVHFDSFMPLATYDFDIMDEDNGIKEQITEHIVIDKNGNKKKIITQTITQVLDLSGEEAKQYPSSTNSPVKPESMIFYPNPSDGKFSLDMEAQAKEPLKVRVIDLSGKEVYNAVLKDKLSYHEVIDIGKNPAGTYVVIISDSKGSISKKLVIQ